MWGVRSSNWEGKWELELRRQVPLGILFSPLPVSPSASTLPTLDVGSLLLLGGVTGSGPLVNEPEAQSKD